MTRQTGQSSTSATPPNKRLVDNTLRSDGELCLSLSVGKASVIIFIEELACSKICVLRLPRMLTYMQNTNKEMAMYIEGMGQSQNTAVLWPNWPTFY